MSSAIDSGVSVIVQLTIAVHGLEESESEEPHVKTEEETEDSSQGTQQVSQFVTVLKFLRNSGSGDSQSNENDQLEEELILDENGISILNSFSINFNRVLEDFNESRVEISIDNIVKQVSVHISHENSVATCKRRSNLVDSCGTINEPDESNEVSKTELSEGLSTKPLNGITDQKKEADNDGESPCE
jgi:hypothetical protein